MKSARFCERVVCLETWWLLAIIHDAMRSTDRELPPV